MAAIGAAFAVYVSLAAAPVPQAKAVNFCDNVWLWPYGDYYGRDRCNAQDWIWPAIVVVQTHEKAGCVNAMDVNYQLWTSWACTGANSYKQVIFAQNTRPGVGIIRNNNLSSGGVFAGNQTSW